MMALHSTGNSPEDCFLKIWALVSRHQPDVLVVDPLSAFSDSSYPFTSVISEDLIDRAKSAGITFLGTSLLGQAGPEVETSASHVSTIADTWLHLSYVVQNGERNRALTIVKSRGTGHSNQVRELILSPDGIDLVDVYVGDGRVLLGSARLEKQQEKQRDDDLAQVNYKRQRFEYDRSIAEMKRRALALADELASKEREAGLAEAAENARIESRRSAIDNRLLARRQSDDEPQQPASQRKRGRHHND